MSIRMPPSVMKRLKEQKNWREFVRSTLIKALEVQEKESEQGSQKKNSRRNRTGQFFYLHKPS